MAKKGLISATRMGNVLTLMVGRAGAISLNLDTLSPAISRRAMVHGLVQKISDAAAIPKDELPFGDAAIAAVKLAAMQKVADRLAAATSGDEWNAKSGDGSGAVAGVIFRAYAEFIKTMAAKREKPVPSDDDIRAAYDAKSRADQLALRNIPEIATIIVRMKAEAGKSVAVDGDALLADLGL